MGFLPGNSLTGDTHTYRKANINTAGLRFGSWSLVYGQLSLFNCKRTGVTNAIMPASGMTITHTVWDFAPAPRCKCQTVKVGAALTVEGQAATAGGGRPRARCIACERPDDLLRGDRGALCGERDDHDAQ